MAKQLNYLVSPGTRLRGEIKVPGDKSISHRALLLAAIAQGTSNIYGLLKGKDNLATLAALRLLGVEIIEHADRIEVHGVGLAGLKAPSQSLDLENAGTGIRLLTGLLASQSFSSILIGDESLSKRPMRRIVEPLTQMGANITLSEQGTAPIQIAGGQTLHGIEYKMPIASAQIKSCLLLAGLYAEGETTIIEPAPSRDHTERMLQTFGYPIKIDRNKNCLQINGGGHLSAQDIRIPGDCSSAAFFIVAGLIIPNSQIMLQDVGVNPTRIGILTILRLMGGEIAIKEKAMQNNEPVADIEVQSSSLRGIEIPIEQVPLAIDELPIILIAAACAQGITILRGAKELRVKESDRIAAMAEGLSSLGIQVEILEDGMIVHGGTFNGGKINSFGDHRIAMSFAIAACVAQGPVLIEDCHNVPTSFPNFIALAQQLGIQISEVYSQGKSKEAF